jgi:hypothetical protein
VTDVIPDPLAVVEAPPEAQPPRVGRTAQEVRDDTPAEPLWLVPGMLARGSVTELNGREKIGKGYWNHYLIGALEHGEATVLGPPPAEGKVRTLIFTEEPVQALKEKFDLFDISNAMVVYHWETAMLGLTWEQTAVWLVEQAVKLECALIFVDNISAATGVLDEAGVELARKVEPLTKQAKQHDLAVLYDRHQRKTKGAVEDVSRGGTGLAGAVDVIVAMQKGEGRQSRERQLTSWGRLWASNWTKQVELMEDHSGYVALDGDYRTRILLERDEWTAPDFAKAVGISDDTARTYLENHPNVEESGKLGRATRYAVTRPPSLD